GEDHDHIDLLGDIGAHVGHRLGRVAGRRGVDDLLDARIRERLQDEFHLGDLAPDVLAEAVRVGDREIAVPGFADVVLPAFERQLALFRRQIHCRVLDRFDDHRRDIVGGADRFQHQFVGVARLRGDAHDGAKASRDKRQRPAPYFPTIEFHCYPPWYCSLDYHTLSRPAWADGSFGDYLFFSHG